MTKSLSKVQKKISKKGVNISSLHENSRNSQRLRRASARDDKLARVSAARAKVNQVHLRRVAYFQNAAKAATGLFDLGQIQQLIQRSIPLSAFYLPLLISYRYLERDDEEMARLEDDRRPGRPRSSREDLLKQRMAMDEREYDGGFWMPDMMETTNLKILREWNGEWTQLGTLKYLRIARSGTVHDSSFPPKGQS
ncbi:hypothetical protein MMC18_005846 [Xylographa bjoerkii]|nr:hypothetical protein [Xylographa bjoerkii]